MRNSNHHRHFALVSLVRTMECNMNRIDIIWDLCIGHFNTVINHINPDIRKSGLEFLTTIIIGALNAHPLSITPATDGKHKMIKK